MRGLAAAHERADVVGICDLNEHRAKEAAQRFGASVYTDYRLLIQNPDIDLVLIILPHHLHYEVALYALEHKKHVLLEKPLTINPADGLRLIEKAKETGVKFSVAENTRFITAYLEAEKLLKQNALGDITLVRTLLAGSEVDRLLNTQLWKGKKGGSGGGVIIDAAPHTFYLLQWFFGGFEDVFAVESKVVGVSEVEDNALVMGRLVNGAEYFCQFSFTVQAPWSERTEIYGSKGSLIIDQLSNPPARWYQGPDDFFGTALEGVPYDPATWKQSSFVAEIKDFIDAVWEDRLPTVDPMDAYYGLLVIEKAYESIATGKRLDM
jgi:predicted dehydrogenase